MVTSWRKGGRHNTLSYCLHFTTRRSHRLHGPADRAEADCHCNQYEDVWRMQRRSNISGSKRELGWLLTSSKGLRYCRFKAIEQTYKLFLILHNAPSHHSRIGHRREDRPLLCPFVHITHDRLYFRLSKECVYFCRLLKSRGFRDSQRHSNRKRLRTPSDGLHTVWQRVRQ